MVDFFNGCDSTAPSSSICTAVLVVLLVDLLVLAGSATVSSSTEVSAVAFLVVLLVFFLVALVVLRLSAMVSSSTELSARARARVALVDVAGWDTV